MIIKLALRNLIRLPWRTILYFAVVFFIAAAMTASLLVYGACLDAQKELDRSYIFVASLVRRDKNELTLPHLAYCLENNEVIAFNVTMSEADGVIPGGDSMLRFPSTTNRGEPVTVWQEPFGCGLLAVENLSLVYPFFSGECTICEGTGFTSLGYSGERAELVIPWWLAEKYGIEVGDTVIRRYRFDSRTGGGYIFIESTVVGIYEAAPHTAEDTSYPAYMPLAVAELDYGGTISNAFTSLSNISIDRADFILSGRDAFEKFVLQSKENGLDFKKANLVFNNSTYDVLSSELANIHMLALFVCCVVLLAGGSVLAFFTAYFCNSRGRERTLLSALGMPRRKITAMLVSELMSLILVGAALGLAAGRLAAGGVCGFVNDTVLERAAASDEIRRLNNAADFDVTMPLERSMKIEISISQARGISGPGLEINRIQAPAEDEIGISRHTYHTTGTTMLTEGEWPEVVLVGMTDLHAVKTSMTYEQVMALPNYHEALIYAYVSESSPYVPDPQTGRTILYLVPTGRDDVVTLREQSLEESFVSGTKYILVIGTYEENEYCSGNDILVRMEDYQAVWHDFSITDETFYFERIDTIVPKGGKTDGSS